MSAICFNIWDDFYDDGFIPMGKIQETHGFFEGNDDFTENQKEEIAKSIFNFIKTLDDMSGVGISFGGEEIYFRHLTHKRLEKLIKELENSGLKYKETPITFYSES